jgi:hypothetical protein
MALITLGANAITALPSGVGGKVLQVVTATRSYSQQVQLQLLMLQANISVSITPSSASNKILYSSLYNWCQVEIRFQDYERLQQFIGDASKLGTKNS